EEGKRVASVSGTAMKLLAAYHWPGNVRQLENAVFRAVVLADADEVGATEFPQIAAQISGPHAIESSMPQSAATLSTAPPDCGTSPLAFEAASGLELALGPRSGALPLLDAGGQMRPLEDIEAEVIRFAIAHYRGQMSEVARKLRIGRSTLYRKLD